MEVGFKFRLRPAVYGVGMGGWKGAGGRRE